MKVKAIREHGNRFGDSYTKTKGTVYDLPDEDAAPLIRDKLVERASDQDAPKTSKAAE